VEPLTARELEVLDFLRRQWLNKALADALHVSAETVSGHYRRVADFEVSATDPDATRTRPAEGGGLGSRTQYVVDGGKARVILGALVTPSEVILVANASRLCHEPREARPSRASPRGPRQPRQPFGHTHEVERGGGRDVAEVRPGQAHVARPPQPATADALGEGALDPRPPGVLAREGVAALLVPPLAQRLVLGLRAEREGPPWVFCR